jgi:O-antigen/teichoic acid export membrane protein
MKIKEKIGYFFKGGLTAKALGFFSFLFIAKEVSLEVFATYAIYMFVAEFIIVILMQGLNSYIVRCNSSMIRDEIFSKSIFIVLLISFVLWLLILTISPILENITVDTYVKLLEYKYLILFILINRSLVNICYGYFISNHKPQDHAKLNIFGAVTFLLILLISNFILNKGGLEWIFYSLGLSSFFSTIYSYFIVRGINFKRYLTFKDILEIIKESSPFMLKSLIGVIGLYLSRIMLNEIATEEELAIYSFYLIIVFQLSFISIIFGQAVIPTIRDNFNRIAVLEKNIRKYIRTYAVFSFFIFSFFIIVSLFISIGKLSFLQLFLKKEYLDDIWLFNILLVGFFVGTLRVVVFDVWQYYEKINIKRKLVVISVSNLAIGLILYPLAYDLWNIYGVAVAYLLITIIFTYVSFYYFNFIVRSVKGESHIHNS